VFLVGGVLGVCWCCLGFFRGWGGGLGFLFFCLVYGWGEGSFCWIVVCVGGGGLVGWVCFLGLLVWEF